MAHAEETRDQGRRGRARRGLALAAAQVATAALSKRAAGQGDGHRPGQDQDAARDEDGPARSRVDHPRRCAEPASARPTSAQGALNVATHGNWKGKWYSSYHEYFITGILGDNETSKKYYWGLYVNGKPASKGACEIKLKSGDKLLFKVTKC